MEFWFPGLSINTLGPKLSFTNITFFYSSQKIRYRITPKHKLAKLHLVTLSIDGKTPGLFLDHLDFHLVSLCDRAVSVGESVSE